MLAENEYGIKVSFFNLYNISINKLEHYKNVKILMFLSLVLHFMYIIPKNLEIETIILEYIVDDGNSTYALNCLFEVFKNSYNQYNIAIVSKNHFKY